MPLHDELPDTLRKLGYGLVYQYVNEKDKETVVKAQRGMKGWDKEYNLNQIIFSTCTFNSCRFKG